MISNYFTLAALAREWDPIVSGATIRDVYSPQKDELAIDLAKDDDVSSIRISIRSGSHFVYRTRGGSKPRSNVTTLFEEVIGMQVTSISMHPSDRILQINLTETRLIEIHLYGSRANVLVVDEVADARLVSAAFKRSSTVEGAPAPIPKPLRDGGFATALGASDDGGEIPLEKRGMKLYPRFGKILVREWLFRSKMDAASTESLSPDQIETLQLELVALTDDLAQPSARLYKLEDTEILSLVDLNHLGSVESEYFDSVELGVRVTARLRARTQRLRSSKQPLLKALDRALVRANRKVSDLEKAETTESRADEYERWGHLLMASPHVTIEGDRLVLADILTDGADIEIPVKPDLTVIANAQRYYARAKDLRAEREMLAGRVASAQADVAALEKLIASLHLIDDGKDVQKYQKANADMLRRFVGGKSPTTETLPFRRFVVTGGFDVWVGRNARENDKLTFDHASAHDVWLHARGTAGSHVVLKVPGRKTVVGNEAKMQAAKIAAWFSSARGSGLVPVIVTEKKYVSKPRGSNPGAVRVQREQVLLVKPGLPKSS